MEVSHEARIASRITVVEKRLTNGNSRQLLNGSTPLVKFTRYSISATVDQMSYVLRAPILKWKPKAPVIVGSRINIEMAFATAPSMVIKSCRSSARIIVIGQDV